MCEFKDVGLKKKTTRFIFENTLSMIIIIFERLVLQQATRDELTSFFSNDIWDME